MSRRRFKTLDIHALENLQDEEDDGVVFEHVSFEIAPEPEPSNHLPMKSTISGRLFAVLSPRNSIAPGVSQPAAVLGGSGALSGGETTHEPDEQRCSLALWMQQRFTSPFRNVNGKDLRSMLAYIKEDGRLLSVHDDIEDAAPEIKRRVRSTFHSMMQLLATDCGVNLQIVASIWTVFQEIKNVHGRLGLRGMKRIQSFKFNTFSARLHALFSGGHAQGIEFENLVLLYGCFNITAEREIKLLACFLTFDETQTGRLDHHDIQELAHGFFKPQADVERRINASDVYRSQEAKKHRRRMKKLEESLEALSGDTQGCLNWIKRMSLKVNQEQDVFSMSSKKLAQTLADRVMAELNPYAEPDAKSGEEHAVSPPKQKQYRSLAAELRAETQKEPSPDQDPVLVAHMTELERKRLKHYRTAGITFHQFKHIFKNEAQFMLQLNTPDVTQILKDRKEERLFEKELAVAEESAKREPALPTFGDPTPRPRGQGPPIVDKIGAETRSDEEHTAAVSIQKTFRTRQSARNLAINSVSSAGKRWACDDVEIGSPLQELSEQKDGIDIKGHGDEFLQLLWQETRRAAAERPHHSKISRAYHKASLEQAWLRHEIGEFFHHHAPFSKTVLKAEAQFGGSIKFVYKFMIWLLEMNLMLAAVWCLLVVGPWFFLNDFTGTLLSFVLGWSGENSCPGPRCPADGRGPETRTFFYYAGYGVENGDFEGFDLNYLMAILLTVVTSFWYIMRKVGKRMSGSGRIMPAHRQYPFTILLFMAVDFSIVTESAVVHMRGAFEERTRETLDRQAASRKQDELMKNVLYRTQMFIRRYLEALIFVLMLLLTGWGITRVTQDYEKGRRGPLITAILMSTIKSGVPAIQSVITSALYQVDSDPWSAIETLFKRSWYFVMLNVILTFWSLFGLEGFESDCVSSAADINLDTFAYLLENSTHASADDILSLSSCMGEVNVLFQQDNKAQALEKAEAVMQVAADSTRVCKETQICNLIYQLIIVDFLMRVLVEGAKWIFCELQGERLHLKVEQPGAIILRTIYTQSLLWVGVMISPVLSMFGILLFSLEIKTRAWLMKWTYLPPRHPWGENRSSDVFERYTLYSLFAVSIPMSLYLMSIPNCGPFEGSVVYTAFSLHLKKAPGFVQASFGEMLYFAFNPTFLLLVIVFLYVTNHFMTMKRRGLLRENKSLVKQLTDQGIQNQLRLQALADEYTVSRYQNQALGKDQVTPPKDASNGWK